MDESQAKNYLRVFSEQHQKHWGMELITKSKGNEYSKLRHAIGLTAGYNRNRGYSFYEKSLTGCSDRTNEITQDLIIRGWSKISDNIFTSLSSSGLKEVQEYQKSVFNEDARYSTIEFTFANLLKTILNKDLMQAIRIYLHTTKPFCYQPVVLNSTPNIHDKLIEQRKKSDMAFSFHRDIDNIKWVKIFINLNTTIGGNHEYYSGSHYSNSRQIESTFSERRENSIFHDEFSPLTIYESHLWTGRMGAEPISKLFHKDNYESFPTSEGYCWIEDTYGLHRGNPPTSANRKLMAFEIGQFAIRM